MLDLEQNSINTNKSYCFGDRSCDQKLKQKKFFHFFTYVCCCIFGKTVNFMYD